MVAETIPDPRPPMRPYLLTLLKTGLPTAAGLGVVGYAFARFAGVWYVSEAGGRTANDIAEALEWRLPLTMAAWGVGLVVFFEGILSLWRKPPAPLTAVTPVDETEQLLLKLLEEAEAAEDERQRMFALGQTPLNVVADAVATEAEGERKYLRDGWPVDMIEPLTCLDRVRTSLSTEFTEHPL